MTNREYLNQLRSPTKRNPLRILLSACLSGVNCGYDGSSYGSFPTLLKLLSYDTVNCITFCPEEFSFGTPRDVCNIYHGIGFDVLNGKAKVLTESGVDWTAGMIKASEKMLGIAKSKKVDLAIMMDISAACGSQVIYKGSRLSENKIYQIGAGVCAAQLIKNGIQVISQRDFASLEIIFSKIDNQHKIDTTKKDHHETEWYKKYFEIQESTTSEQAHEV